ncbi:hypothetical protein ASG52_18105 [Methylobacterium sp. Leaf456]|uniref:hypothetical protein n=1 Tax=Methylobacterium sp. Leaf456 TaxID=1736382 RepID=UPI0006F5F193|nr:hypothetical protein [Methylobacterium sp. Leaf456]KQT61138.1 hypothetical protein ASG52_18105 [Methylobacterium sp. Leaf456]
MTAAPSRDPQTARHDKRVAFGILGLVAATVLIGALAPMGQPAGHKAAALAPADDPACAEWGDGCKVCQRLETGAACSLPGIACTPGKVACLRGTGEP